MHNPIVILGMTLVLASASISAQTVGSVRGTIRYASGAPLAGATVITTVSERLRDARSDSLGRFQLDKVPAGSLTIEVLCPNRDLGVAVPVAVHQVLLIQAGRVADVPLTVARDGCTPIPPRDTHVHWKGWYAFAFENSSFRPCASDTVARELLGYGHPIGRRAWVMWAPTVWRRPGLAKFRPDTATGGVFGFVEWSGVLHGPAPAGHMGISNYLLTVDSVFDIAADGRC